MSPFKTLTLAGLSLAAFMPAAAHAWTKSYVVEWMEPAFYYGGPKEGLSTEKGADCPNGVNPEMDWDKQLLTSYRPKDKVAEIHNAEYPRRMFLAHLGFRGPHKENVYENPTSIPDPGLIEVTGKIAEGFDLDDNPNTGFTGLNGEKGIDNGFYKASGCINFYRGRPKDGSVFKYSNEAMHNGGESTVIVISGSKDPMNDNDVTVGMYTSKDRVVKDASGEIAADYSYGIDPKSKAETVFKAKVVNGVLEATERPTVKLLYNYRFGMTGKPLELFKGKIRIEEKPDGGAYGLVGGYREFLSYYHEVSIRDDTENYGTAESLGRYNVPAWYYAMRRAADGLKDPATGQNLGISTAYRLYLRPAFVYTPDGAQQVTVAKAYAKGATSQN